MLKMPSRRATGGIMLVAFAIALLVVLTVELLQVSPVTADEEFHVAFHDLRDYVAGVIASSRSLPPDEVIPYVNSSLCAYEETLSEKGLIFAFYYDDEEGQVWYYLMHGDNYAVGVVPLIAHPPTSTEETGDSGSGVSSGHLPIEFSLDRIRHHVPVGAEFRHTRAVFIKSYLNVTALVRIEGGPELIGMHIVVIRPHQVLRVDGNVAEFYLDPGAKAVVTFEFSTEDIGDYSYVYVYSVDPDYSDQEDTLVVEWVYSSG